MNNQYFINSKEIQQMRIVPKIPECDRRSFLAVGGMSALGLSLAGSAVIPTRRAWAQNLRSLSSPVAQTLLQMARDIYPHDRFPDRFYQIQIEAYDTAAVGDPDLKALLEDGVAQANQAACVRPYTDIADENERVAILRQIEQTPLFQKLRGDLVVSLYNQTQVWNVLGYEGPSADKGGYLYRGFNDLNWL